MRINTFHKKMEKAVPGVPSSFHNAMVGTLGLICRQEEANRNTDEQSGMRGLKRRTLAVIMAAILVIVTAGLAAGLHYGLFDTLLGASRDNAETFIQRNLAKVSFGECDVEVKEAAYDGISLFLVYSVRERTATKPIGVYDETIKRWWADERSLPAMERDNIGWWSDSIWINGKGVNIPNMSGGDTMGSDTPGELLFYQMYRLDQEDVYLTGKVEIALPIGGRQQRDNLIIHKDTKSIELPAKGMITFTLDASARDKIVTTHPNVEKDMPALTAKVSEVNYTPLNVYITLDYVLKPEAGIVENGDANAQGEYWWDKGERYAIGLDLVDGSGKPVYDGAKGFSGNQGAGQGKAWFMYPALETYPEAMFLAPVEGGKADMSLAVRVK